jgi:phosphopentomutase
MDLGTRSSFADLGQTVARNFGLKLDNGRDFLGELVTDREGRTS